MGHRRRRTGLAERCPGLGVGRQQDGNGHVGRVEPGTRVDPGSGRP